MSVVTFTRNRGNMLRRCINSVLSQTYENIEHVVIDGASTDNTDEVIKEFNDKRLKYFKLETRWPQPSSLIFIQNNCHGKYISFLDSDDEYLPTKIEKQVSLIESLPGDYGFVYCWMSYYDSSKNNTLDHVHGSKLRGFVADEVLSEPLISGTPTLLFRTNFFIKLGGWKSVDEVGIASDWELCARACQLCKVDYVPESLVNVYVNHGSVRQSESEKYYEDSYNRIIKFHKHFLSYFKENFKRRPDQAVGHYISIALNEGKLKHYLKYIYYMMRAFFTHPRTFINNLKHS